MIGQRLLDTGDKSVGHTGFAESELDACDAFFEAIGDVRDWDLDFEYAALVVIRGG